MGSTSNPFKASGLVSHSTLPESTTAEVQHHPIISIHPDLSRNSNASQPNSSVRRDRTLHGLPIASGPTRHINTIHPSSINQRQPITPQQQQNQPLTPSRKRARKQQLLAPHGSESPSKLATVIAASAVLANSALPSSTIASTTADRHVNIVGMLSNSGASVTCSKHATGELVGQATTTAAPKTIGKGFLTCHSAVTTPSYSLYAPVTASNYATSSSEQLKVIHLI